MSDLLILRVPLLDPGTCRVPLAELTQHPRELDDDPSIGGDAPGLHPDEHLAHVGPARIMRGSA